MFIPEVSSIERQVADLNNAPGNVPQDPSIKKKKEKEERPAQVLYLKRQLRDLRAKLSSRFIAIDRRAGSKERLSNSLSCGKVPTIDAFHLEIVIDTSMIFRSKVNGGVSINASLTV